jgi:hypothetical protein
VVAQVPSSSDDGLFLIYFEQFSVEYDVIAFPLDFVLFDCFFSSVEVLDSFESLSNKCFKLFKAIFTLITAGSRYHLDYFFLVLLNS